MIKKPNVHPSIYPKLIELWNKGPRHYRDFLTFWGFTNGECDKIRHEIQDWVKSQKNDIEYPNEEDEGELLKIIEEKV